MSGTLLATPATVRTIGVVGVEVVEVVEVVVVVVVVVVLMVVSGRHTLETSGKHHLSHTPRTHQHGQQ